MLDDAQLRELKMKILSELSDTMDKFMLNSIKPSQNDEIDDSMSDEGDEAQEISPSGIKPQMESSDIKKMKLKKLFGGG